MSDAGVAFVPGPKGSWSSEGGRACPTYDLHQSFTVLAFPGRQVQKGRNGRCLQRAIIIRGPRGSSGRWPCMTRRSSSRGLTHAPGLPSCLSRADPVAKRDGDRGKLLDWIKRYVVASSLTTKLVRGFYMVPTPARDGGSTQHESRSAITPHFPTCKPPAQ